MIPIPSAIPSATATPGAARDLVRDVLDGWDGPEVVDDAVLLVSELVTNAIDHAQADPASVAVTKTNDRVRVEVSDPSVRPPVRRTTTDPSVPGGFGLGIVDEVSDQWGVIPNTHGKTVWFELHARRDGSFE